MIINYDIENDELIHVLNDSPIQGLSFASEVNGKIALFVVDGWNEHSYEIVEKVCSDFGYECYVDLN